MTARRGEKEEGKARVARIIQYVVIVQYHIIRVRGKNSMIGL